MATLQDTMKQRQQEMGSQIGNLYDRQYDAQAAQLRSAYDRNMSDAQAEQAKIAPQYQTQANQMAAAYERNRRNANLGAMNSGLGTGNAVQQQLALNSQYQKNYAGLRGNELQAQAAAAQNQADAENKKAAATIDTQNDLNNWYDQQAKVLAGYGDFSAYERLYGKEAADYMRRVWELQNPKLK